MLLLSGAPAGAAAGPRIRFLTPTPQTIVTGPTEIELTVEAGDAPIVRVEIRVDGVLLAALVEAPFRVVWDAGGRIGMHRFQAEAVDAAGRRAKAEVHSRRVPAGEVVEVTLVELFASVVDERGRQVKGLQIDDFQLFEDDRSQTIQEISPDPGLIHVALLIDTSRSMRGDRIKFARKAAHSFVDKLAPDDRAMILSFSEEMKIVTDWTGERGALHAGLDSLQTGGGTALYDGLHIASRRLRRVEGRKGMILLSDGRDESYDGLSPGSLRTFDEALEEVQRADVTLYAIGLGLNLDRERDFSGRWLLADLLERASRRTGGRSFLSPRPGQLKKIYEQVSNDLRHQYRLTYYSSQARHDGRWREIRLAVSNPRHRVRTRAGYFAPAP